MTEKQRKQACRLLLIRAAATMRASRCASDLLFMFGHHERVEGLFKSRWAKELESCSDYLQAAHDAWISAEILWPFRRHWVRFFDKYGTAVGKAWMSPNEKAKLSALPIRVTVWRGFRAPHARNGMSWSLSRVKAQRTPFARVHERGDGKPYLLKGRVDKSKIVAYLDERKEREIVVRPDDVEILSEEEIQPKK